tara:strand:- start:342 stop:785 length:444 start_codon:yes stop_codon:yes gene_type:complete
MNKIARIGAIALGVLGVLSLFFVFATGDDEIKMAASMGQFGVITPIILVSQLTLLIAVVVTLTYSFKGLMADKAQLKSSMISFGLFIGVFIIAFLLSKGVETPMRDGKVLSALGSKLVGTGIRVFYILSIIAVGLMVLSGRIRSLKK